MTGGDGFIGSQLVGQLADGGAHPVLVGPPALRRAEVVDLVREGRATHHALPLDACPGQLELALGGARSLVHLGYRPPGHGRFWDSLGREMATNVAETVRLLDAAERAGVGHVCFASSMAVYGPTAGPVDEGAPTEPATPYALAKLGQEDAVRLWARRSARPASVLRLATVYGPGDRPTRAIPGFIQSVLRGVPPVAHEDAVFEPLYVGDAAAAVVAAVRRRAAGTYNIGTGVGRTPREVAELVVELMGAGLPVLSRRAPSEVRWPVGRVEKAAAELGFEAPTTLAAGLRAEISWLRAVGPG